MDETRLQQLISSWVDGAIVAGEMDELVAALRDDAEAQRFYLNYMSVHAELCSLESAQDYLDSIKTIHADPTGEQKSSLHKTTPTARNWRFFAIAVGLLLAIGIWQGTADWPRNNVSLAVAEGQILDAVEPLSDECKWYVEQSRRRHANSYLAGDVIRVTTGKLELYYAHGTKVVLHAPAAYQLMTKMKARMLLGRLTATVTEAAKGFSVLTPRATVVDLGTQFGVEVNYDGATDVVVFKGEVDVDYDDDTDNMSAQRLRMGEAVHLDAVGTASRIVSINGRTFSKETLSSLSRPAVIAQVHDNIERNSSMMNYYEIVHQGMQEDALAFVDRVAHQWNGVDAAGMPRYLLGADYVKTFNSDKFNQDLEISVHVNEPCRLYVLCDNRLPAPAWLRRDFQDTGDDIGMDTGPFQTTGKSWHNKGPSGVGPGASIEDTLSIWVRVVSKPSVVLLGSTEAPISEPNMYGIAAAPLGAP